jgi:5-methylcytosine-specific restriction endonuclease McrA
MPYRPAHICGCGNVVPSGVLCACQRARAAERNARAEANRPNASQRGYDSKWRRESRAYLAANPRCRRCGATATLVDHVEPHRGNRALFWKRSNWQALCVTCHSVWKQSQEKNPGHNHNA